MNIYREFRPQKFEEVKGQDVIVRTLTNQLKRKNMSHAYLFNGTRGTGKTSVAKIFAKALNCLNPINGYEPCNECASCKNILAGTSMSVIEIDAASNNGVDNIRTITEQCQYRPVDGTYKVFIIDEVHMLSNGAFNALLKTLEEPPLHVKFILATTEKHKVPQTILSRCQTYTFNRIDNGVIEQQLKDILVKKGVSFEERAITYVARAGEGSMRDAESLLETCLSFAPEITYDSVVASLGTAEAKDARNLAWFISQKDVQKCIAVIEKVVGQRGVEVKKFTDDIIWYYRNLMLYMASNGKAIEMTTEEAKAYAINQEAHDIETVMRNIRVFSELAATLKNTTQPRVMLEVAVMRAMTPQMETDTESLLLRIRELEKEVAELKNK